jgi:hypothetical protein
MDFSSELPPLESADNRSPTLLVERFSRKEISGDLLGSCKDLLLAGSRWSTGDLNETAIWLQSTQVESSGAPPFAKSAKDGAPAILFKD